MKLIILACFDNSFVVFTDGKQEEHVAHTGSEGWSEVKRLMPESD